MEALRRIQNNSINLPWDITCGHLTEFAQTMQISGYSEYERYNAIKGAIQRHREMMREIEDGKRSSLFRDKNEIMEAKKARMIWLNTWFLKGDTIGTVSCPTTPGGKLKEIINSAVNRERNNSDGKLLIVEDGGKPIHVGLRVDDPC